MITTINIILILLGISATLIVAFAYIWATIERPIRQGVLKTLTESRIWIHSIERFTAQVRYVFGMDSESLFFQDRRYWESWTTKSRWIGISEANDLDILTKYLQWKYLELKDMNVSIYDIVSKNPKLSNKYGIIAEETKKEFTNEINKDFEEMLFVKIGMLTVSRYNYENVSFLEKQLFWLQ